MSDPERFLDRVVGILGLVDAALIIGISSTWAGLFGGYSWFFDLFSHFRLQYSSLCLFGVAWYLWREKRLLLWVSLASLVLNAVLIFGWLEKSRTKDLVPEFRLRVASINVLTSNRSAERVLDFIRGADADVVFLMEVDARWAAALEPLRKEYPHVLLESRQDNFGVALFSRLKDSRSRVEWFGDAGVPTVVADLRHQGRDFRLVGTHPLPPVGGENTALRDGQLDEARQFVEADSGPVLLLGDMNASPWSAGMRILTKGDKLRLPSAKFIWGPTWKSATPLAVSIDHALASAPLQVLERKAGPDVGSDHRPILIEVGWER